VQSPDVAHVQLLRHILSARTRWAVRLASVKEKSAPKLSLCAAAKKDRPQACPRIEKAARLANALVHLALQSVSQSVLWPKSLSSKGTTGVVTVILAKARFAARHLAAVVRRDKNMRRVRTRMDAQLANAPVHLAPQSAPFHVLWPKSL